MMPIAPPPPSGDPRPGLPLAEDPWTALWRALWLDLPLVWADEMDRFLFRPTEPMAGPSAGTAAPPSGEAEAASRPETAAMAVALGLGCGDYADEIDEILG